MPAPKNKRPGSKGASTARGKVAAGDIAYPEYLTVEKPPYRPGVMRVPVERFFKQEYHDLEVERIWKKAWQWVCREEDIPEVGDYIVYDVAELSFIIMRVAEDAYKAYWNACPHRARKLREFDGKCVTEIRCMFHGFAWQIDGSIKEIPSGWDFPGTKNEFGRLDEARTGTWGGFVFINPDDDSEPLADFLGEMPEHFENSNHDFSKRWKQVHVVADIPANWKVVQEAFLEAWHVNTTHPQLVFGGNEGEPSGTRWDDFGNWMRAAPALPTDMYKSPPDWAPPAESEQQAVDSHWDVNLNQTPDDVVQEGQSAAEVIAGRMREFYRDIIGDKVDEYHDVHMFGGEMVHVWPNFHPWGGLSRLVYRFRPYRDNPQRALMDIILLAPWPEDKPRPPPAPIHYLGPDEPISNAPELGMLARVFLQDMANMPRVQEGLKTSKQGYVILSNANEAPVRHLHNLYNQWMGLEDGEALEEK